MSLHLVIGGVRSGKSELAERIAGAAGAPVCFVATGSPSDPEMVERIARHRRRRPVGWRTVESDDPPAVLGVAPPPLPSRRRGAPPVPPPLAAPDETVLVDGIGSWVARLMVAEGLWTDAEVAPLGQDGETGWERLLDQVRAFAHAASTRPGLTVVVAEEGGLGLVPQGAGARRYLDLMGEAMQLLAKAAAEVQLVVAGQAIGLEPAAAVPAAADQPTASRVDLPAWPGPDQQEPSAPEQEPSGPDLPHPSVPEAPARSGAERPGPVEPDQAGRPAAERPGPSGPEPARTPGGERPGPAGPGPGGLDGVAGPAPSGKGAPAPPAAAAARAIPTKLRLHGDTVAAPGQLDFAVNVIPGGPPAWLRGELLAALNHAGSYPDQGPAVAALADRHGRDPGEVLPTNGSAEAFWLLANVLRPARPVVVHPSFTEPEVAMRVAGHTVQRAYRHQESFALDPGAVPDEADLVVVGNPNNPTGNLDPADQVASLARPGRVLVVDEAFMEFTEDEAESLAGRGDLPGLVVVRSLTKLWALPGVRAGYLLCAPDLAATLRAARQPWSVNAVACAALAACAGDRATAARVAERVAAAREELVRALGRLPGVRVWPSAANFLLLQVPAGPAVRSGLAGRGIAVRPADSFPGLGPDYVRVAVRSPEDNRRLATTLREVLG
ncbi:MAG TPA: Rv2231c family pyridoxal phosphate-dependent protein CobC [Actinomycetes bacterium]